MRPIDKTPDRGSFPKYEDAQQPLTGLLGAYCSYCERWIASAIHVEHKLPKSDYPVEKLKWANFLLSCNNCNSGKGHGKLILDDYVWPDVDNTFLAFQYDAEGRVLARTGLVNDLDSKVHRTWKMLGFDRHPDRLTAGMQEPTKKDLRWLHRREAWQRATRLKNGLAVSDTQERRAAIADMATERGMFSIWMTVFENDVDIRQRLIVAFPGTAGQCFDAHGRAVLRAGGQL